MAHSFKVWCPAKVNLILDVGPLDSNGYHPLRTLFQAVGLFDELTVVRGEEDTLRTHGSSLPPENTITRALRLIREFGDVPPLEIELKKRIPLEAGLGGGSSDAAGLLRVVNRVAPAPFAREILHEVACAVGSDVPFFLVGGRALGEGYGERLTPLDDEPCVWLVIAKPREVGTSTPEAYRALDQIERPYDSDSDLVDWRNDFELVMPDESKAAMASLRSAGARRSLLSGSGSAVFGEFTSQCEASQAATTLALESDLDTWVAPTLSRAESLKIES